MEYTKKSQIIDDPLNCENKSTTLFEIDEEALLKAFNNDIVHSGKFGATVSFVGSVRSQSKNGYVKEMDYEAYIGMAEAKIKEIENMVRIKWDIKKIKIIHRLGKLKIGDKSIIILVSTPHSKDAFEACQFILKKIKKEVPIWKKETFLDGSSKWIDGNVIK